MSVENPGMYFDGEEFIKVVEDYVLVEEVDEDEERSVSPVIYRKWLIPTEHAYWHPSSKSDHQHSEWLHEKLEKNESTENATNEAGNLLYAWTVVRFSKILKQGNYLRHMKVSRKIFSESESCSERWQTKKTVRSKSKPATHTKRPKTSSMDLKRKLSDIRCGSIGTSTRHSNKRGRKSALSKGVRARATLKGTKVVPGEDTVETVPQSHVPKPPYISLQPVDAGTGLTPNNRVQVTDATDEERSHVNAEREPEGDSILHNRSETEDLFAGMKYAMNILGDEQCVGKGLHVDDRIGYVLPPSRSKTVTGDDDLTQTSMVDNEQCGYKDDVQDYNMEDDVSWPASTTSNTEPHTELPAALTMDMYKNLECMIANSESRIFKELEYLKRRVDGLYMMQSSLQKAQSSLQQVASHVHLLVQNMDRKSMISQEGGSSAADNDCGRVIGHLPLCTEEDLVSFDGKLVKDEEFRAQFGVWLKRQGDLVPRDCTAAIRVSRIMKSLFHEQITVFGSWTGVKKVPLENSRKTESKKCVAFKDIYLFKEYLSRHFGGTHDIQKWVRNTNGTRVRYHSSGEEKASSVPEKLVSQR